MHQRPLRQTRTLESPRKIAPIYTMSVLMAADAGIAVTDTKVEDDPTGDLWPPGTPIFFDGTAQAWKVWTNGQAIQAFTMGATGMSMLDLHEGRTKLLAADTAQSLALFEGEIHYSAVFLPPGETENDLKAALRTNLREDNIRVTGLDKVR